MLQRHAELFGIDAICLSHLHADHCLDLGAYWVARQYAPDGPQPRSRCYGPPGRRSGYAGLGRDGGGPVVELSMADGSPSVTWLRAPVESGRSGSPPTT